MLWYGFSSLKYQNLVTRLKGQYLAKPGHFSLRRSPKFQLLKLTLFIHKPFGWDLLILSDNSPTYYKCNKINYSINFSNSRYMSKAIYLSSDVYYFQFVTPQIPVDVRYVIGASTLSIHSPYLYPTYRTYWTALIASLSQFWRPIFLKLKFKGKGYYIYKNNRNTVTPQFGYSHRIYVYSFFVHVKFLSKTSIFLFGLQKSDLITAGLLIKRMRSINIFTGRGVRFSKEVIYKKAGKISSYR